MGNKIMTKGAPLPKPTPKARAKSELTPPAPGHWRDNAALAVMPTLIATLEADEGEDADAFYLAMCRTAYQIADHLWTAREAKA